MPETILYESEWVKVGRFEISPQDPDFARAGWVDKPLVVFPKTPIWIQQHGSEPYVSDLSIVNLYNREQAYHRAAIDPQGDYCHWLEISPEWLEQITGREEAHFATQHVNACTSTYVQHLKLLKQIDQNVNIDELALDLVFKLLPNSISVKRKSAHRKLMYAVKETIQADLSENWSLEELAKLHATSAYHLCRVFKAQAGMGISQYRQQQRLRYLTWRIKQGERNFSTLAHDLGYSSHSHMTSCFKSAYGTTPRQWASEYTSQTH